MDYNLFGARTEAFDLRSLAYEGLRQQFHLVKSKSNNLYYSKLRDVVGVEDGRIFTTLPSAYTNLTASQGDILYVWPGDHVITAMVTWAKADTKLVGIGAENQRHQPSTLTTGGIRITCKTTEISYCFTISGQYVTFENIGTINTAAHASNLGDILITGRNFNAKKCAFRGGNAAEQVQSATSGIPVTISTDAYGFKFEECELGSAGNATRTTGPGFARFAAGAGGAGMFDKCAFSMRSETTGANPSGFTVEETALDRLLTFRNGCTFYNFSENWGALPDYLFNIDQTTTFDILIDSTCMMAGFDIVSDSARVKVLGAAPNSAAVETVAVATS